MKVRVAGQQLVSLAFLVGILQYVRSAIIGLQHGSVDRWTMDVESLQEAGIERYAKDAFMLGVGILWPSMVQRMCLPHQMTRWIRAYFQWMIALLFIGTLPYWLNFSPIFFLPCGIRWLLLLHLGFGLLILSKSLVGNSAVQSRVLLFLATMIGIQVIMQTLQLKSTSSFNFLAIGKVRLTGAFSNAGVAGFFAIAVCLVANCFSETRTTRRLGVELCCLLSALFSGTRLATLIVVSLLLFETIGLTSQLPRRIRTSVRLLVSLPAVGLLVASYMAINSQVGRGDAITQQFGRGGRVGNMLYYVDMLSNAGTLELLIGRGLGVATNAGFISAAARGDPLAYRFNYLTDNAFLPGVFQFGLIGATIFWLGLIRIICDLRTRHISRGPNLYWRVLMVAITIVIAGGPFEHYFLMISMPVGFGIAYWRAHLDREGST